MDFTLLRLLLATAVVFAHYAALTGVMPGGLHGISSTVAVQAFFVVSGWIVTASFESSSSTFAFFVRRLGRLYPLYAAVVIAQALVVLALMPPSGHAAGELAHYLGANLALANFLKPTLLGFLDGARVEAINPSLWTMKVEVAFYLCVPVMVILTRRFGIGAMVALFIVSTLFFHAVEPVSAELAKQLPGQLRFFAAGMLGRLMFAGTRQPQYWNKPLLLGVGVAGLLLAQHCDGVVAFATFQPIFVAAFVVAGAVLLPAAANAPDISFGVYLLHAPVIQFTHQTGLLTPGGTGLAAALAITVALAIAACYLIERPAVRASGRLSRRLSTARGAPDQTTPVPGIPS